MPSASGTEHSATCEVEYCTCTTIATVHFLTVHIENHITGSSIIGVCKVNPFAPLQRIFVRVTGVVIGIDTHGFDLKVVVYLPTGIVVCIYDVTKTDIKFFICSEREHSLVVFRKTTCAICIGTTYPPFQSEVGQINLLRPNHIHLVIISESGSFLYKWLTEGEDIST